VPTPGNGRRHHSTASRLEGSVAYCDIKEVNAYASLCAKACSYFEKLPMAQRQPEERVSRDAKSSLVRKSGSLQHYS
jgi:hypothetical protein